MNQGHMKIDVEKALQMVSERKRSATGVRERVLSDLMAVFNSEMTFREAIECGFAMADSDEGVAMHIGDIKLKEIFGTSEDKPKTRQVANKERVQKTLEAILEVLRENIKTPMTVGEIRAAVPQFDDLHFRSAWHIAKQDLKKTGEGRKTAWQLKKGK